MWSIFCRCEQLPSLVNLLINYPCHLAVLSRRLSDNVNWNSCIPNQWIVFFARSDRLIKLRIEFAIHLPAFLWISHTRVFLRFSGKKELFGTGYPLLWYILKQLFTSVSVKSGNSCSICSNLISEASFRLSQPSATGRKTSLLKWFHNLLNFLAIVLTRLTCLM